MRVRAVGVLALMALVLASCGGATPEAAGPTEGIQVHGDWTIDVYNPDGSLDEHHEFSNALTDGGQALAAILTRQWNTGVWRVALLKPNNAAFDWPCVNTIGNPGNCVINEDGPDSSDVSTNLVVSPAESVAGSGINDAVLLSGSIAASNDGDIGIVTTDLRVCADGQAPSSSCAGNTYSFTEKVFVDAATGAIDPIPVSSGQVIAVEVLISFTSG